MGENTGTINVGIDVKMLDDAFTYSVKDNIEQDWRWNWKSES